MFLSSGQASFHLWDINEVYSNSDGSVQFIELFTTSNSQQSVNGKRITSTGSPDFVFPSNSGSPTANQHLLLATGDINGVSPDFVIPAGFLFTGAATVNFVGADLLSYVALPVNGFSSLDGAGNIEASASPTNFAGEMTLLTGFTVNSDNDVDDGTCDAGHCSLREATELSKGAQICL